MIYKVWLYKQRTAEAAWKIVKTSPPVSQSKFSQTGIKDVTRNLAILIDKSSLEFDPNAHQMILDNMHNQTAVDIAFQECRKGSETSS